MRAKRSASAKPPRDPVCTEEGCQRPSSSRGLCHMHYKRLHYRTNETSRRRQIEKFKAWRAANPERAATNEAAWRRRNPGRQRELERQWAKENPDKCRAATQKRRTAKQGAGGSFTATEWRAKLDEFGHRCPACGSGDNLTADHIIPVSWGGPSHIWNIQPLCKSCNSRKRNHMIVAYAPR